MDFCTGALMRGAAGTKPRPTQVNTAQTAPSGTSSTTISLSVPSGVQNGDLLIAIVSAGGGAVSSWTQASFTFALSETSRNPNLAVAYRIASSEPASYTFTAGASALLGAQMIAFRGAAWDTIGTIATTNNTNTLAANGITVAQNNAILLGAWAINNPSSTFTTPTGMSLVASSLTANNPNWAVFSQNVSAGATSTRSSTFNTSTANASAVLFSLIPS